MNLISVYCDGSQEHLTGCGGYGYVMTVYAPGRVFREGFGSLPEATCEETELFAVFYALLSLDIRSKVVLRTDSKAALLRLNGQVKHALADAVEAIIRARGHEVYFMHLPRNGHPHAKRAHQLARRGLHDILEKRKTHADVDFSAHP